MKKNIYNFLKKYKSFFSLIIGLISIIIASVSVYITHRTYNYAMPQYKEFIEQNKIPNLNGERVIELKIDKSSYKDYINDTYKYRVFFIGAKNQYEGKGEKYMANGNLISHSKRDKISFDFIIKNGHLYGFYTLYGKERTTRGNMQLKLNKDGNKFKGNFKGTAANAKGEIIGYKK